MFKSGFVTIVGKPNAGKSTLLNAIIKEKVAIATPKKNTTRNQIKGIYNDDDSQIVFIDTPGFLKDNSLLEKHMKSRISDSINGVDIVLFLLPFWKNLDEEYLRNIQFSTNGDTKKYILLSKIDKATNKKDLYDAAIAAEETGIFDKIIPISSIRNTNIDHLIFEIKKDLNEDVAYYDRDKTHEFTDDFYVAEIIREKALFNLSEEIPHEMFVTIPKLERKKGTIYINAEIILARDSLKSIVIGKNGEMLGKIGTAARIELEKYFGKKIYLETFVKVRKKWQEKDSIIKSL